MAKHVKGLNALMLDVDFFSDSRILALLQQQGTKAISVYISILCDIYRNGYYGRYDASTTAIVTGGKLLCGGQYVSNVIACCVKLGLFDAGCYSRGILTSKEIQEQYLQQCKRMKRKVAITEYSLIDAPEQTPVVAPTIVDQPTFPIFREPPKAADELRAKVEADEPWRIAVARRFGIDLVDVDNWLNDFFEHCAVTGKVHHYLNDFKGHFVNWLGRKDIKRKDVPREVTRYDDDNPFKSIDV